MKISYCLNLYVTDLYCLIAYFCQVNIYYSPCFDMLLLFLFWTKNKRIFYLEIIAYFSTIQNNIMTILMLLHLDHWLFGKLLCFTVSRNCLFSRWFGVPPFFFIFYFFFIFFLHKNIESHIVKSEKRNCKKCQ